MSRTRATHTALTAGTRDGAPPTGPAPPPRAPSRRRRRPGFPTRRRKPPPPPPSSSSAGAGAVVVVAANSSSSRLHTAGHHASSSSSSSRRRPGRPARTLGRGSFTRTPCLYRAPPSSASSAPTRPLIRRFTRPLSRTRPRRSAAYGLPSVGGFAALPPQPLPSAPALPPAPWDPALLAALHTAPTPQQYTGGGDWYMDAGATAHMAANPGNLLTAHPIHTAARITVPSDVAALPAPGDGRSRASLGPPPGFEGAPPRHGLSFSPAGCLRGCTPSLLAPATPLASPAPTTPSASPAAVTPPASPAPSSVSPADSPVASEVAGSSSSSPAATLDSLPCPMTRSRAGTFRPSTRYISDEYLLAASVYEPSPLPSSARAALRDPHWLAAMQEEFNALQRNRTW
nr:vegetative cell wall protein gp1-like [Aegilops tauschii subsp. strangulata]